MISSSHFICCLTQSQISVLKKTFLTKYHLLHHHPKEGFLRKNLSVQLLSATILLLLVLTNFHEDTSSVLSRTKYAWKISSILLTCVSNLVTGSRTSRHLQPLSFLNQTKYLMILQNHLDLLSCLIPWENL